MAFDTAAKQHAMLNFWDGTTIHLLPIPAASIGQGEQQHLLDLSIEPTFEGGAVPDTSRSLILQLGGG